MFALQDKTSEIVNTKQQCFFLDVAWIISHNNIAQRNRVIAKYNSGKKQVVAK